MKFDVCRLRLWCSPLASVLVGLVCALVLPTADAQSARSSAQAAPAAKSAKVGASRESVTSSRQKNRAQKSARAKGAAETNRKKGVAHASLRDRSNASKAARAHERRAAQKSLPQRSARSTVTQRSASPSSRVQRGSAAAMPVAGVSAGERMGLRQASDPLDLSSSVALVVDQDTSEVLLSKNDTAVLPIASLTKLMTGLVVADAQLPLDELITITEADAAVYRQSRLEVGATLSRGEMMHLALMSSENRAANALGRTFPGGSEAFVERMNAKAHELGMRDTRFVEPTGLSSDNRSSARDLATLVTVAYDRPILRDLSTSQGYQVDLGRRTLQYNNSNRLVRNPEWDIGLQKTGYISAAGRCLVMQAQVAGRKLIMVFLDSAGKLARLQDAERVRRWVEAQAIQRQFMRPQG